MNTAREKINLTESLAFMQKFLGPNHEIVKLILGDKTPEARATELIEKTRITDPEINALLRAGGKAAVDVATDPMIVLARTLEPRAQAVEKRYADEVTTVQAAAYPKIGAAVVAVDGGKVSSDATGTLRLSYGTVKSYMEDGKKVPPYTYIPGLYERSAQHDNQDPYELAPSWVAAKSALDPKVPFNMVTTNDIVGGNSGSAMVDKKGELVGLIFDGNPPMLAGLLHLLRRLQPRDLGGLAADPRGAAEGLQGRRARDRDRRGARRRSRNGIRESGFGGSRTGVGEFTTRHPGLSCSPVS